MGGVHPDCKHRADGKYRKGNSLLPDFNSLGECTVTFLGGHFRFIVFQCRLVNQKCSILASLDQRFAWLRIAGVPDVLAMFQTGMETTYTIFQPL